MSVTRQDENEDVKKVFKPNEPVVVLWDNEKEERDWWIGFYICHIEDDAIKVDHLTRQNTGYKNWVRGNVDVQPVNLVQVVPIDVNGDWNLHNDRHPVFVVDNNEDIEAAFVEYLS